MSTLAGDAIELEAMHKEDSSWHPCQVSLSSDTTTGFGLILDFGSQDSEEIIFSKEEALARLRIRSTPLQGDECCYIKEGEHVLANQKTQSGSLFFDANVEKVCRIRHSKKIHCRCTFEIKWLHSDLKGGTMTVPSSSIKKLARDGIDSHPTVAAFLSSVKTLNFSGVSPFVSLFQDTVCETDLPTLLEKQIEEISKLADTSRKGSSEEFLFELKRVDFPGQARHKMVVTSQPSFLHDQAPIDRNNSRRSTRSQSKLQLEMNSKNPPPQSILEEPNRPHLSPLGARAALASLMYKLPQKSEFAICHVEKEGFANASQNTPEKHVNVLSLDMTRTFMDSDVCIQEKLYMMDDLSSRVEAHPAPVILKRTEITKSPTSGRRGASNKSLLWTQGSPGMPIKQEKPAWMLDDPEDKSSNIANVKTSLTCSVTDRKSNRPMKATRLTHSEIQKGLGHSNDEVELKSSTEDMKLSSPTHSTRLTRSALQKGIGNLNDGIELMSSTEDMKLSSPTHSTRLTRSALQKGIGNINDGIELMSSTEDMKLSNPTHSTRLTRSALQKGIGNLNDGVELKSSTEDMKLSSPTHSTRLTRSELQGGIGNLKTEDMKLSRPTHTTRLTRSVIQKEVGNLTVEVKQGPEVSKSAQDVQSETKESRKKKAFSSPVDAEINLSLAQGRNKKLRVASVLQITKRSEGDGEGRQDEKKKFISSKKHELRFSPRLRFLPRTRSQMK